MKTLVETSLFNLFASYTNGAGPALGELPAAYDDFVNCLATLSPAGDLTGQLRCLNYTKIELAFMRQACNGMAEDCRNILYDGVYRQDVGVAGCGSGNTEGDASSWYCVCRIPCGSSAGKRKQKFRHTDMERYGQRPD